MPRPRSPSATRQSRGCSPATRSPSATCPGRSPPHIFWVPAKPLKPPFAGSRRPRVLIGWAKHSFLLDIEDKVLIATHFDRLAHLANSVPCFHLDYPRNFDDLPGVLSTVVAHAEGLEGI